jgi:TrpR family trp operon transcriptional repressor
MAKGVTVGEKDIQAVADLFAGVSERLDMRRLLNEILTPAELRDLALRWRLVQRLHAGEPQRRIAAELGISLCKITRGSRILKQPQGVIRGILGKKKPQNVE